MISKKVIELACQGDKEARNKIINYYSKIVIDLANNYDYIEYEDLVQYGMIKLIEIIDNQLRGNKNSEIITTGFLRTIKTYFANTLRNQVVKCNTPLSYIQDDLENKIVELEFKSVVNSYTTNKQRREIINGYFLEERTIKDISNKLNIDHEEVRKTVKLAQPQLKKMYLK